MNFDLEEIIKHQAVEILDLKDKIEKLKKEYKFIDEMYVNEVKKNKELSSKLYISKRTIL